ncbi:MAG: oligosaccharide flippase family protein [Candidatus Sulfotelmatobacter sp.]
MSLKQFGFQGSGLVAKRGFLALAFLVVARSMGPSAFGDFSYVCTWLLVCSLLLGLGLAPVTTREIARHPETAKQILKSGLLIRITLSLLGIAIFNFLFQRTPVGKPGIGAYAFFASFCLPPLAFADQISAYALGFDAHHQFAIINGTVWGLFLLSTGLGVAYGHGLVWVFVFQLLFLWIAAAVCVLRLRKDLAQTAGTSTDWGTSVFLLRESTPLVITSVLGILSFRIGTFLLYRTAGSTQTGLYTSALQAVEGFQLIAMAVTGAKFPVICRVIHDECRIQGLFEKLFLTLTFLSLCLSTTACVVGNRLIVFVFGRSFNSAGHLFAILVWTSVPMFLHYGLTFVLIAANRQRVFVFETAVYLLVSVAANVVLIHRCGVLGAVYAAILTESTLLVMHLFFVVARVKLLSVLAWSVFPSLIAAAVLYVGLTWTHSINSALANICGFCVASVATFGAGYWCYWRWSARGASAVALPAEI